MRPFWWTLETRWCSATLTPTIPPGSPEQEMTGERPEEKCLMGRSTVCSSLQTKFSLLSSPSGPALLARYHTSEQASPSKCDVHVYPYQPWVRPPPHNSALTSYAQPSPWKARSYTNFRKADCKGFTAESERRFAETPLPTSCSAGKKVFWHILSDVGRHHIPCGYVGDYCSPLPDVVRPFITEREQRYTDDPLDPAIKLLDQDIQRHIHQEAQDQWRTLLESSHRATNPKRYRSLPHKLGGKRSSPPPNISIAFERKTHPSSKAIA